LFAIKSLTQSVSQPSELASPICWSAYVAKSSPQPARHSNATTHSATTMKPRRLITTRSHIRTLRNAGIPDGTIIVLMDDAIEQARVVRMQDMGFEPQRVA